MRQLPIAVIIPAFNAESFLHRALESVGRQRAEVMEVVLVDDGSNDGTWEVMRSWEKLKDLRIKAMRQDNMGASAARNVGILASSAPLIAPLDADDEWDDCHLESLIRGFEFFPNVVLSFGDSRVVGDRGTVIRESNLKGSAIDNVAVVQEHEDVRLLGSGVFSALIRGNRIATCSSLYKRNAAIACGLYDTELRQTNDRDFLLRLSKIGQFAHVMRTVSTVHRHNQNLTHSRHRIKNIEYRIELLGKLLRTDKEWGLTYSEVLNTKNELDRAYRALRFRSANEGMMAYFGCCIGLFRRGRYRDAGDIRNFARAVKVSGEQFWGKIVHRFRE